MNITLSKWWANKNYSIQKHFEVDQKERKKFGRRHIHVYVSHTREHFQSFSIMSSINTKLHLPKKSFWHLVLTLKKKSRENIAIPASNYKGRIGCPVTVQDILQLVSYRVHLKAFTLLTNPVLHEEQIYKSLPEYILC